MKKILSCLLFISFVLTACGEPLTATKIPSATKKPTKTPKPESTVEMGSRLGVEEESLKGFEINVWHPWFGVEASMFETMVSDFNAVNPWGIKVTAVGQVNFGNLFDNVASSLPMANRPDLAIALPEHALQWNEDGILIDLMPYIEDPVYGMDTSDFPAVFLKQDQLDDKRVALPAQRTARVLLWNKTWAGELGFDSPPASANEFRQQSCRAQKSMALDATPDNDGRGGWIVDAKPMTAYSWLLAFDGGVLEAGSYRFLTPNNIEAFKFLKELVEDACAWQTADDPTATFVSRQALFISAGPEDFPSIARAFAAANSVDEWVALPYPGKNSQAAVVYGSSYMIFKSSPEKSLASWLFIRWMLEAKQDARLVEATHLLPLRASSLDLLSAYRNSHPQWDQTVKLIPQGRITPQIASWRTVKTMLGDGFADMFSRVDLASGQVALVLQEMQNVALELNR